jgi:hypothetical protein
VSEIRSLLAVTCGLLLLSSCSGGAPRASTVSTATHVSTVTQTAPPPVSIQVGKSYLEALLSADATVMREGLKLTAANSVAYHYLDHQANMAEGLPRVGAAAAKAVIVPAGGDAFSSCSVPADRSTCATYGGFKVNGNEKLVDLAVDNEPVGPRLSVGSGQPVIAAGTKFTFLTALRSAASGTWMITIRVQTGAEPIRINPRTWAYRGPDGKPLISVGDGTAATHLVSNASLTAVVMFESAKAGGTLTVQGCLARLSYAAPGEEDKLCPGASFSAALKIG